MQIILRNCSSIIIAASLSFFLWCSLPASAQTVYNWNSPTSSWATPGNWSPNGTPGAADTIGTPLQTGTTAYMEADRNIDAINVTMATGTTWAISPAQSGPITRTLNVNSITKAGSGTLTLGSNGAGRVLTLNAGTITMGGGTLDIADPTNVNVSGLVTINSGSLRILSTLTTRNFTGGVHLTGGGFDFNRTATVQTTKVAQISGTTGTIQGSTNNATVTSTLEINGSAGSSSFSGVIQNGGTGRVTALSKTGGNTQTLAGSNTYSGGTSISGGTLLLTNASGSGTGTGAVSVLSGGGFGGSGNGTVAGATTAAAGSFLIPGSSGLVGNFKLGNTVDIAGLAGGPSGGLLFDLGSSGDVITLTAGALTIGSGQLGFEDFNFSTLSGFAAGTYTLFDTTTAISGSLGSNLSGAIGGFNGTISLANSNTDLILTVAAVPEPSATILLAIGATVLLFRIRHRSLKL